MRGDPESTAKDVQDERLRQGDLPPDKGGFDKINKELRDDCERQTGSRNVTDDHLWS